MLGLFVYGISLILIGFSKSFMQLVIFRVIQGVGLGLFGPAALCLVAQVREKGKGFALCRTANSLGLLGLPFHGQHNFSGMLSVLALKEIALLFHQQSIGFLHT
jgi:MFS family permease